MTDARPSTPAAAPAPRTSDAAGPVPPAPAAPSAAPQAPSVAAPSSAASATDPTPPAGEPTAVPLRSAAPGGARRRAWNVAREFAREHAALLLFLGALAVLLPGLSYGLWDPWETHYAEVARRVVVDGDWITLRWGNADSAPSDVHKHFLFFSKPILSFWLMALSFLAFGVSEFAARLPIALFAAGMVGLSFFYLRRLAGTRGALLSALLLLFTPMFAMLGRHAMTDVPFVAPMTVGTLAFAAVLYDPRTSPRHAYVGYVGLALATLAKGLLGFLLPGAALLVLLFVTARSQDWKQGGASLADLLAAARRWWLARRGRSSEIPAGPDLRVAARPWLVAAAWAALLVGLAAAAGGLLARKTGVRYGALAGAALVLVLAVVQANGERWRRLRLPTGIPLFLALCATWYLPVILRHGMTFVREFFLVHHFGRASTGIGLDLTGLDIHDNTSGYYLQQLGYALFPWLAALPAAVVAWARSLAAPAPAAAGEPEPADGPGGRAVFVLAVAWAAVTYVLFTVSQVKFHHYIFPAVPALAVLGGVGLDRLLRRGVGRWEVVALLGGGVLAWLAWREMSADPHRLARLFSYRYTRRFPEFAWMRPVHLAALGVVLAGVVAALVAAARRARRAAATPPRLLERAGAPVLAGAALLAAAGLALTALHGYVPRLSRWISQQQAFHALDAQERRPDDRLVSWANNWRGEVFYSRDRVIVVEPGDKRAEAKLRDILRRPGRAFFITTDPRGLRGAVSRAVGAAAARDHFRLLTPEGEGGFAAALYDGPVAGRYQPRIAALPPDAVRPAGVSEGRDLELREPSGGGRLQLAAVRLGGGRVRRGGTVPIDLYFRCLDPSRRDWEVFIHADAPPPARTPRAGNGDHGFTGGAVATSACRPGELLLDRWDLEIAPGVPPGAYQVFAGLWHPPSGDRMKVSPEDAARSPGAGPGPIEAEYADRAYLGELVVEP